MNIILIYRTPNCKSEDFILELKDLLSNIDYISNPCVIMGDFNIDLLKKDKTDTKKLQTITSSFNFHPINTSEPTRITHFSSTLIDHIYVNKPFKNDYHNHQVIPTYISDHFTCTITYKKCKSPKQLTTKQSNLKKCFALTASNKQIFSNSISTLSTNISTKIDTREDLNSIYNFFIHTTHQMINNIPFKFRRKKLTNAVWINNNYLKLSRLRDKQLRIARKTKLNLDWIKAKSIRNQCTRLATSLKRTYFHEQFKKANGNPKKAWHIINNFLPNKKSSTDIPSIQNNDKIITNQEDIVNAFNLYFSTLASKTFQDTKNPYTPPTTRNENTIPFNFKVTNTHEVHKQLLTLKNFSPGYKSIAYKFINLCPHTFSTIITNILNYSLTCGSFPDLLKIGTVIPIHKKDCTKTTSNYRPISILPNISKIFERTVYNQITSFLNQHNLLYKLQSGFRKNYSTLTSTTYLLNTISTSTDKNLTTIAIFLDMSKAFDLVNHQILLHKLENQFSFSRNSLDWVSSYLNNRSQLVNLNNTFSNIQSLPHYGVPQGSILGPLFFLLFIDDIKYLPCSSEILLYADDIVLLLSSNNNNHLITSINSDLQIINTYCNNNNLHINILKSKGMVFNGDISHFSNKIYIQNNHIDFTLNFRFLGYPLEADLKFTNFCTEITKKLSSSAAVIRRCSQFLPIHTLKLIFNCTGLPYINYGAPILLNLNKTQLQPIITQYNECHRNMLQVKRWSHTSNDQIFSILSTKPLTIIITNRTLNFLIKIIHQQTPHYLSNLLTNQNMRTMNFFIPRTNYSTTKKTAFSYWGPYLWSLIPIDKKTIILETDSNKIRLDNDTITAIYNNY